MLARVSLARLIMLLKDSGPASGQCLMMTERLLLECFNLSSAHTRFEHLFYFASLSLSIKRDPGEQIQCSVFREGCRFVLPWLLFPLWKWPAVTLCCWFCSSVNHTRLSNPLTRLTCFRAKDESVTQLSITPGLQLKAEQRRIICQCCREGRLTRTSLLLSCLVFPTEVILAAWIPGRQNDQWGVKSVPH